MRRILVEDARRKRASKAGGGWQRPTSSTPGPGRGPQRAEELLAVDEALSRLAAEHPASPELVKLRYFVGLTIGEAAAQVLGISAPDRRQRIGPMPGPGSAAASRGRSG